MIRTARALAATGLLAFASAAAAQNSFGEAETGGGFGQTQPGQQPPQNTFQQPPQTGFQQPPQTGFQQPPQTGFQQPPQTGFQQPPQNNFQQPPQNGFQNQPTYPNQQPVSPQPPQTAGLPPQLLQYLDNLAQYERQDLGVPPTQQLHTGPMHGATPASIPGGQVITTRGLVELIQGRQVAFLLFDVLGAGETLPGAIAAVQASSPGSFGDQISQQMGNFLRQATQGNAQVPLIFYCASRECWMSYNAALRAINLGYRNVLWYRGGLEAWKQAGGPVVQPGGYQPQGQNGYQPQPGQQQQPWQQQGGQFNGNGFGGNGFGSN